jgi:CubicO group peptidase (beta-lactamase class C family)
MVDRTRLALTDPISAFFPEWRGSDRDVVTVQDLLEHASGLAPRLVDPPPPGRREFEHDICTMPLEYVPRTRSLYSDLGFILLGFLVSDRGNGGLDRLFDALAREIGLNTARGDVLTFRVPADLRGGVATTLPLPGDTRRGRVLSGEVHDDYAAALGGVAGHAGLFGNAAGVGAFARVALRGARGNKKPGERLLSLPVRLATRGVPGSSRALGWDTMLPTSSCGMHMTRAAFGHVGFTGTSLWIDPGRDRYFMLLTNRVAGEGTIEQIGEVRRAFHDALADV